MQGRNDECRCGSKKIYKYCCLEKDDQKTSTQIAIELGNRFDFSLNPHYACHGIRNLIFSTLANITIILNEKYPSMMLLREYYKDLYDLTKKDSKEVYLEIAQEIVKTNNNIVNMTQLRRSLKLYPSLNQNEYKLIETLAEYAAIEFFNDIDHQPTDYAFFRVITELMYNLLKTKKVKASDHLYFLSISANIKDGKEYIKSYELEYTDQKPANVTIYLTHEEELYNQRSILDNEFSFLEERTKRMISTLNYQLKERTESSNHLMSYATTFLGLFACIERELKSIYETTNNNGEKLFNSISVIKLIETSKSLKIFNDNEIDKLHYFRLIRNRIQHEDYETDHSETIDFQDFLMNNVLLKINHLKSNLISY